jgi:hypothetical protein
MNHGEHGGHGEMQWEIQRPAGLVRGASLESAKPPARRRPNSFPVYPVYPVVGLFMRSTKCS